MAVAKVVVVAVPPHAAPMTHRQVGPPHVARAGALKPGPHKNGGSKVRTSAEAQDGGLRTRLVDGDPERLTQGLGVVSWVVRHAANK